MSKIKLVLILLIFLVVGVFSLSVFLYQRVVNEEQALADDRCINVNPIITERKKAYLTTLVIMGNSEPIENLYNAEREYIKTLEKDVVAESAWLEKYNVLINRWDFRLLVPAKLQEVAKLRGEAFNFDKETARYMTIMANLFINEGKGEDDPEFIDVSNNLFTTTEKRNEAYASLDVLLNNPNLLDGILNRLIRTPESKCPSENRNIPDVKNEVEKMFNPEPTPSAGEVSG